MSFLDAIISIEEKLMDLVCLYNEVTGEVYFQPKRFVAGLAGSIRGKSGKSGAYVYDGEIKNSAATFEIKGLIEDWQVLIELPNDISELEKVVNLFNLSIQNDNLLSAAIETESPLKLVFNASDFRFNKVAGLEEDFRDKVFNKIKVFGIGKIPQALLEKSLDISSFLINFSDAQNEVDLGNTPESINGYILTEQQRVVWPAIENILRGGFSGVYRLFTHGIAGSGKTDFAHALNYHFGTELVHFDCSSVIEQNDWTFRRGVQNGSTHDELTDLAKALLEETDEPVIILLDELSRNNPMVLNPLMQMLGEQKVFKLGKDFVQYQRPVLWIITANIGSQYTGTDLMDLALLSRMDAVIEQKSPTLELLKEVATMRFGDKIDAETLDMVSRCIYEGSKWTEENEIPELITIRELMNVLKNITLGLPVRNALWMCVLNKQDKNGNRQHVESIINNIIL